MMDIVNRIFDVHVDVFYIIVCICVAAALLKREILGSDLVAIFGIPVYIMASLVSLFIFRYNYWVVVSDRKIEAVIASSFGITVTFLLYLAAVDLIRFLTGWHVKRIVTRRKLVNRRANQD
jgi:hypothetical protein